MRVVCRYAAREISMAVAFVLVGFLALFGFFDFVNELDDVGRAGYQLQHALAFVLLSLPGHIYELMPIAALIGTVYALSQLASNSEFTAMRAAGLGPFRALYAIFRVGLVFAVATLLIGELVIAPADQMAQRVRMSALGSTVTGEFRSGLWIKDTVRATTTGGEERQRFVNIAEITPDVSLRGVRVFEFDGAMRLTEVLEAASGRFSPPGSWLLSDVTQLKVVPETAAGQYPAIGVQRTMIPELVWRSELTPALLGVLMVAPDRMSGWNLVSYIGHLRENRQDASRYEIAMWQKIVYPFAVLVMMALALPSAYLQIRSGGVGLKVFGGIMLGITFHFLNGLFTHLGLLNTWPAWIAVSIPSAVAFMVAMGMLSWVGRVR